MLSNRKWMEIPLWCGIVDAIIANLAAFSLAHFCGISFYSLTGDPSPPPPPTPSLPWDDAPQPWLEASELIISWSREVITHFPLYGFKHPTIQLLLYQFWKSDFLLQGAFLIYFLNLLMLQSPIPNLCWKDCYYWRD